MMTNETIVDPSSLVCTSCGALPGESCKTRGGTERPPHQIRNNLAFAPACPRCAAGIGDPCVKYAGPNVGEYTRTLHSARSRWGKKRPDCWAKRRRKCLRCARS